MPFHVEEMVTEVTIVEGELPLNKAQLDKLADYVIARLKMQQRDMSQADDATALRAMSEPQPPGPGTV